MDGSKETSRIKNSVVWLPSNEEDTDKAFLLSSTTSHGLAFFHNLPWVLLSFNKGLVSVRLSHMTRFWPVRHELRVLRRLIPDSGCTLTCQERQGQCVSMWFCEKKAPVHTTSVFPTCKRQRGKAKFGSFHC